MHEFIKQAPTVGFQFNYNSAEGEWNCYVPLSNPGTKARQMSERGRGWRWVLVSFICRYEKRGPIQAHHLNITVEASSLISSVVIGAVAGESFSALSLSGPLALYLRDFPLQDVQPQSGLPTNLSYPSSTYCTCQITSWPSLVTKSRCATEGFKQIASGASKYKKMCSGDLSFLGS